MAIDADEVVAAAVHLLDAYGMADLSMRRVADQLGVKAGALYWHVANKQTLLALVADEVLGEVRDPSAGDALVVLPAWAGDLRRVLLGHRDSAELVATGLASRLCRIDPLVPVESVLSEAGVRRPRWGAEALLHLVLGHVGREQDERLFADLGVLDAVPAPAEERDRAFGYAVDALVSGLLARRDE